MALPELSTEDRQRYLKKAEESRKARAHLREQIKSGEVALHEVFEMDNDIAKRMKVSILLESLPGIGKAKAAKTMTELGISESRRVQGLGIRQREQLLAKFDKQEN